MVQRHASLPRNVLVINGQFPGPLIEANEVSQLLDTLDLRGVLIVSNVFRVIRWTSSSRTKSTYQSPYIGMESGRMALLGYVYLVLIGLPSRNGD